MKKILVIDGKSVFYRAYYSFHLNDQSGEAVGAVYGFFKIVFDIIQKLKPEIIVIAWDKAKTNIRSRQKIYPEYKAGRKKPNQDFYEQVPILMDLLGSLNWAVLEYDDYEADDIMATIGQKMASDETFVDLISGDLDLLQAIALNVKVFSMKTGASVVEEYDLKSFEEKYGVTCAQFLDLKAIKGDQSDNLPGVAGIGEKGAVKLLQEFGSLDGIYANMSEIEPPRLRAKLELGKKMAYVTREVAQLQFDAPIDEGEIEKSLVNKFDLANAENEFLKYGFQSFIEKIKRLNLYYTTDEPKKQVPVPRSASQQMGLLDEIEEKDSYFVEKSDKKEILVAVDLKDEYRAHPDFVKYKDDNLVYDLRQASFLLGDGNKVVAGDEENLRALFAYQRRKFAAVPKLWVVAHDLDFPLAWVLYKMEKYGIKIDRKYFAELAEELNKDMRKYEQEVFDIAGETFNLNSSKQLSEVLFAKMLLPTKNIKKKASYYSTGEPELAKLKDESPIIKPILQYREVKKLLSTYVEALPKLVDANSRLHTTFTQDITSTGRLSSVNPNLQNIPVRTELGRRVRTGFLPEEGFLFVAADYSQFELRLAAFLADDKKLMKDFADGIDIHRKTASEIYGVPLEDVTKEQRSAAKTINFGVLYGMGALRLANETKMSMREAADFIKKYFEIRKPIAEYIEKTKKQAVEEGYVETFFGRRKTTEDTQSYMPAVRAAAIRAAVNMPIQGTEADLMKMAMIRVQDKIDEGEGIWKDVRQVLQIHDSIMLEVPAKNAKAVGDELASIMVNVSPEIKVKLAVEVKIGKSWGEVG
ncbi:MAG: hypothetical protein LBM97_01445 [Candidatus Nomurabacteria bacterium]|nr:hypothetical protein [Candidatus Nomurabacteria bacterium]